MLSRELKAGLVVLIAGLVLYFGISYLKNSNLFKEGITLYSVYDKVEGIMGSQPVTINGLAVGQFAVLGEGGQVDDAAAGLAGGVGQVLAGCTRGFVLLDLGVGLGLHVLGAQFLDQHTILQHADTSLGLFAGKKALFRRLGFFVALRGALQQRLMLDFEKRQISVDDGRRKDTRMDGEIVVRARLQRGQLILTQVMANKVSVDAIIDTGSEVSIGNAKLRDALMLKNSRQFQTITVIGVTGTPAELQLIRVSQLKLGSVTLRDVPIAFADIPPFAVFGIDDQPSLLLGTDVMETFRRVQLDFRERRVRFQLRKCAQVVRISTTGNYASRLSTDNEATCRR